MSYIVQFSFRNLNADLVRGIYVWIAGYQRLTGTCETSENTSYTREKKLIDQA